MKKISETILFFGSGPVAAKSLELLSQDFTIEAVVTKPKPKQHRGDFPVPILTEKLGINTLYAGTKQEVSQLFQNTRFQSRLGIVIDYGVIISKEVIDYFPLGIINSHFSVLPEWRGADPITFAILSGQKKTGVSIMQLVEALDEGPILGYGEYTLTPDSTTPDLTHDLIELSHTLLLHELPRYLSGETTGMNQEITKREVSYSRKLNKKDGLIDWTKPAEQLEREIRAFIEWPKSRTQLFNKDLIITKAHVISGEGQSGTAKIEDKTLIVFCGKDALAIDKLKPAGKREMLSKEFLAGHSNLL